MYAVEFYSMIDDGNFIKIPQEYRDIFDKINKNVKVIILSDELNLDKEFPEFNALSLNTKDFKFNREYANEK